MPDTDVTPFPRRFEAEITLAARARDLIMESAERHGKPTDGPQGSDVAALLDAIGRLLRLDELEADGQRISQRQTEKVVARLESAVRRFHDWPPAPRLRALAPVVEALDQLEIDWLAAELVELATEHQPEGPPDDDVIDATERTSLALLRIMMRGEVWDESFEELLQVARHRALRREDDDDLRAMLNDAVIFNAIRGRQALLAKQRRRMAEAEPLPHDLLAALDEFATESEADDLVRWSLHLVLADAVAAGVVPPWAKPRHVVTAVQLAIIQADDPELDIDVQRAARWARMKASTLRSLRDMLTEALFWQPDNDDGDLDDRQQERWRIASGTMALLPARWTPTRESVDELPPYSTKAALRRLEKLPDVAWMMIDGLEAVRFISEAFRFGGDAPDFMDPDVARKAIRRWRAEQLVDFAEIEDVDEDGLSEDRQDDDEDDDRPMLLTSDGQPLVHCASHYEFDEEDRVEVVRRLDAMAELHREHADGRERWVWLDGREDHGVVLGSIAIAGQRLTTDAMSVVRSARIGARLSKQLGELITLVDVATERVTP